MNFIDCDSLKRTLIPANFMNIYDMPWISGREEWWKEIYIEKTKPPTQFTYHGIGYYYKGGRVMESKDGFMNGKRILPENEGGVIFILG